MERRQMLALMTIGLAAVLTGCHDRREAENQPSPSATDTTSGLATSPTPTPTVSPTPSATVTPFTGPPFDATQRAVLNSAPRVTNQIALTIDDGFDPETVSAYVEFARKSGVHITFSPNAVYDGEWAPHAATLQPLIAAGQVQIGNHTFHHRDLTKLTASQIAQEVETNEAWINKTFGTTSRPYLRPPYGSYNQAVAKAAGDVGFTKLVMWNGSFGDSGVLTPEVLMQQARLYLKPGTIMLGHANHPTVTHLYDQIMELITSRSLTPVTLDEMFGSSRPPLA